MAGATEQAAQDSIAQLADFNSKTAKTHTGIYRDLAIRKRKTEVDPQIGIICQLGRERGVDVPALECLVALIHDIEDGRKTMSFETFSALIAVCERSDHAYPL